MNKKRLKGFTLMELVVVLAIVGVLALALIPSMSFFMKRAKLKTNNAQAKVVFNAALTYSQECESRNLNILDIKNGDPTASGLPSSYDFTSAATYSTIERVAANLQDKVNDKVTDESETASWAARYENKGAAFPVLTGAIYASTENDKYVGCYPTSTSYDLDSYKSISELGGVDNWLQYSVDGTVAW